MAGWLNGSQANIELGVTLVTIQPFNHLFVAQ